MYLGKKQLGQEVAFSVVTVGGGIGTPLWPSLTPTLDVWQGASLILHGLTMPAIDRQTVGLFQRLVFLDARFGLGACEAIMRWTAGTYLGVEVARFEVVAGGDAKGAVIAMAYQDLPHARYLVMQADSGRLLRGKNPSFT